MKNQSLALVAILIAGTTAVFATPISESSKLDRSNINMIFGGTKIEKIVTLDEHEMQSTKGGNWRSRLKAEAYGINLRELPDYASARTRLKASAFGHNTNAASSQDVRN